MGIRSWLFACTIIFSSNCFAQSNPALVNGLQLWLKADTGIVLDPVSGKVSQWMDNSSNSNSFVQNNTSFQPLLGKSVVLNGASVVSFNGSNTYLSLLNSITIGSCFVVVNWSGSTSVFPDYNGIITQTTGSDGDILFIGAGNSTSFYTGYFGSHIFVNGISSTDFSPIANYKMIYGFNDISKSFSSLLLGSDRLINNRYWQGNIAEIIAYSQSLSITDRQSVEVYLKNKYSPPVALPKDTILSSFLCDFTLKPKLKYPSLKWSTGATTDSILVNKAGVYTVTATGFFGDVSVDSMNVRYEDYPNLPNDSSICLGETILYDTQVTSSGISFQWLKAGIVVGTLSSINIGSAGLYTLSITSSISACSFVKAFRVQVDSFPILPVRSDTSLCSGNSLSIKSFGNTIKSYLWNGLVTTSSFQITTGGGYTLKTVNQNNCINNTTFNVTISGIAPSVIFTSSVISDTVCVSSSIQFSNGSTFPNGVNSLGYRWDFGNGISNGSVWTPQTTTYTASGQYFVTLSVAGDNGCSNTFSRKMTVLNNPVSIFTSSAAPNCQRDTIRFFNGSQANNIGVPLSTYLWNFGNPSSALNTSTIPNPSFAYSNTGNYTVTYQVGNKYGCKNTSTRVLPILGAPIVNFTATKGCFGTPISFSDSTVNAPNTTTNSRLWSFGNGSSSTASNATITYSSVGSYTVSLLSTNNVGCSSSIKKTIIIKDSPVPGISYGPACSNSYVQFYDNSSMVGDTIINWSWQFGSSQSSALQNPKVILGDTGTYNVSLTVGTKTCTTTISRPERVKVNIRPSATFVASPTFGSPPLTVTLTSSLTGISSWKWTLGQSTLTSTLAPPITAIYPDSGQFKIRLSTYLSNGCVDSTERIILVSKPIIDLSVSSLGVSANNGNQQISVLLSNVGNIPIDGVTLYIKSKEGFEFLEKSTLRLDVGSSTIYTFNGQIPTNTNRYPYFCVEAWPSSLTDSRTTNNKTCKLLSGGLYVGNPFPNPTSNDLYLPVSVEKGDDVAVILVDMLGQQSEKTVYSFSDNGFSSVALPTSNLAAGVYMIYLTYQDQVVVKKFIKN